ncbi:MAG: hypothetical protein LBK18_09970 [Prevotellaceae bacterium]|jgi:hypothetical protein|nr:hypothetical protein [Prevotellaceae bacterium]
MRKIFENATAIVTREDYDKALLYVKALIREATSSGALDNPEADNSYTREIGRVGCLCADYESEYIAFKHIQVSKKAQPSAALRSVMGARSEPSAQGLQAAARRPKLRL